MSILRGDLSCARVSEASCSLALEAADVTDVEVAAEEDGDDGDPGGSILLCGKRELNKTTGFTQLLCLTSDASDVPPVLTLTH